MMSSADGTYAPKSPDLSSFYSAPAPQPSPSQPAYQPQRQHLPQQNQPPYPYQQQQQQQNLRPHHLQPPAGITPQQHQFQQAQSPYDYQPARAGFGPGPFESGEPLSASFSPPYSIAEQQFQQQQGKLQEQQQYYSPQAAAQQLSGQSPQALPLQPPQQYYQPYGGDASFPYPYSPVKAQPQSQPYPQGHPAQVKTEDIYYDSPALQQSIGSPTRPAQPLHQLQPQPQDRAMPPRRGAAQAAPPPIAPSPVRTKFPTARIKRIMQADEEVGKVAQQTPIAVGKALELFMIALVSKSADVAKEKNSKRVTAQMLKHVVESDEQWDFLREIVGKVDNEEKAKAGRAKAESESEEEEPVEVKKKAKAVRKKKN